MGVCRSALSGSSHAARKAPVARLAGSARLAASSVMRVATHWLKIRVLIVVTDLGCRPRLSNWRLQVRSCLGRLQGQLYFGALEFVLNRTSVL